MKQYILRRLRGIPLMLLVITFVCFLVMYLTPGDPALTIHGDRPASPEMIARIREFYALDDPFLVRYGNYLRSMVRGDFGTSLMMRKPVARVVFEQLPATIELAVTAMVFGTVVGLILGVVAAIKANTMLDGLLTAIAVFGVSIPGFWLGLLLMYVFSVRLRLLPITGEGLIGLVLPAITVGTFSLAYLTRMVRSSLLEVLHQDYIRTARAKGLRERVVVFRHALKNALLPVISLTGLLFGQLVTGSVIVETVFARKGIGKLLVDSVLDKDIPVVQLIVLLIGAIYMFINLAIDVLYGYVDPRITYD